MTPTQPAMRTDGAVSAGTVLWRFRGRLQLTVVVKAVFAVLPDSVATPRGPGEIVAEDRHAAGSILRSVEAAGDLAPYLPRCDVLFTGHAYVQGGATAGSVRLGVSRDGRRLIDKTLHVYGDRGPSGMPEPFARMPVVYERALGGPGTANPVGAATPNFADPGDARRPAGFGPTSRLWPARRALLGPIDPRTVEAPIAEIPEAMPWEYFQAAPRDQQIEPLRGGEWIVLDGLHPTRPRVQTCLPQARGAARVEVEGEGSAQGAVDLVCDTLAIDGDRQTLSLTWRGRYEVTEGEAALPSLVVLAALELPGVPVDWARIRAAAAVEQRPKAKAPALLAGTMAFSPDQIAAILPKEALPFAGPAAPARPQSPSATPWSAAPPAGDTTQAPQPSPVRGGLPFPASAVAPKRSSDAIPGAPWSRVAAPPVPPREQEPETFDLDPSDLEVVEPEAPIAPPPRVPERWESVVAPPPVLAVAPQLPAPPPALVHPAAVLGIAPNVRSGEITLERCAEMRAEMDTGFRRDEVLARAGVSGDAWTQAQRAWLEKMGAELERGRFELTNRYTQAFLERQRALTAR